MLQGPGQASDTPAEDMTADDAQVVHDYLKPFVDSGHIRAFTGNEYLQDFGSGDTWAAIVWSGDLASSAGPDDVFVFPEEGSMIWTDNMIIPKGAAQQVHRRADDRLGLRRRTGGPAGELHLLHLPVKGVAEAIKELDPEAGDQPAAVPAGRRRRQAAPAAELVDEEDEPAINELFADLTGRLSDGRAEPATVSATDA